MRIKSPFHQLRQLVLRHNKAPTRCQSQYRHLDRAHGRKGARTRVEPGARHVDLNRTRAHSFGIGSNRTEPQMLKFGNKPKQRFLPQHSSNFFHLIVSFSKMNVSHTEIVSVSSVNIFVFCLEREARKMKNSSLLGQKCLPPPPRKFES